MTKIFCSDPTCRFIDKEGFCEKKQIELSFCIRNGEEYHLCRSRERDPEYRKIEEIVRKVMKGDCDNAV